MPKTKEKDYFKKKIHSITVINRAGIEKYHWSDNSLWWDELPKWLLHRIEMEFPDYQIKIEYKKP